jgi:uncharacterized protein YdbL (DUF1318 family)
MVMGCARVRVEAPKDPIKVDVSMRLDVYQHVVKDIDDIENMVSAPAVPAKTPDKTSWLRGYMIADAYAQEGFGADVEAAAARRRDRRGKLTVLMRQGAIGENRVGLLEVRNAVAGADTLVSQENEDRMLIYRAIAAKNGTSLEEVQKPYAKRLQQDAPAGAPLQAADGSWSVK